LRDDTLRTLIYTPDASRAMALLGNTPSAYGQTWHLPCDEPRTYQEFIGLAAEAFGVKPEYVVLKKWQIKLAGILASEFVMPLSCCHAMKLITFQLCKVQS